MIDKEFMEAIKQTAFRIHTVRKDIYSCTKDIEQLKDDLKDLADWIAQYRLWRRYPR